MYFLLYLVKIPVIQQELSTIVEEEKKVYSDDQMPLKVANISHDTVINLKNLGPQIKWGSAFYIEYAGPLIILPLLFFLGKRE